jgi:hypothetical protein
MPDIECIFDILNQLANLKYHGDGIDLQQIEKYRRFGPYIISEQSKIIDLRPNNSIFGMNNFFERSKYKNIQLSEINLRLVELLKQKTGRNFYLGTFIHNAKKIQHSIENISLINQLSDHEYNSFEIIDNSLPHFYLSTEEPQDLLNDENKLNSLYSLLRYYFSEIFELKLNQIFNTLKIKKLKQQLCFIHPEQAQSCFKLLLNQGILTLLHNNEIHFKFPICLTQSDQAFLQQNLKMIEDICLS